LTNLLSNAAKFTRQGVISVTVGRQQAEGKDWVVVSVADTGIGIGSENLGKLFKPFGKLSDRKDNPEGTGLGLAICKMLCDRMGASIGVTSILGTGSTFTVRLPPAGAELEAETASPKGTGAEIGLKPAEGREASLVHTARRVAGPCTVLAVDDDPQVGEMMKRFLEKQGFVVHVALTGVQALEMVKPLHPDVIVLDVLLPGIDGWGVLAALKNDAETADIPVIILSIVGERGKGVLLGAAEYVTKPVDWERLAGLLRKYQAPAGRDVLVVEDDARWRELCRRTLEKTGWHILEAADGAAALRCLAEHRPSLILLDLMLPIMDGFEFLEHVRRRPECRHTDIIVMTAKELTDVDHQRLNGGIQAILKKGSRSLDELLEDVLRGVQQHVTGTEGKELENAQDLTGRR
jgi:CheY-like chemotaxis protein